MICFFCCFDVLFYDVIFVLVLRGVVEGLVVYCDNDEYGCKMVLKLEKLLVYL